VKLRKCKVMYGRDQLATLSVLPDGRWELAPTGVHLPLEILSYVKMFDPYLGVNPPQLVTDWFRFRNLQMDPQEPIAQLIQGPHAPRNVWFAQEGR